MKGSPFNVTMVVNFYETVKEPIFAFSIKDVKGTEITGTNTMLEKAFLKDGEKGKTVTVTFTQNADLQGGDYLISFGCTGFIHDTFTVYHRLYDAISLSVISDKNTVGFYDTNSVITISES